MIPTDDDIPTDGGTPTDADIPTADIPTADIPTADTSTADTDVRPQQASAWNIANALTILRIALVPVFAWFLLQDGGHSTGYRLLAFAVFAVATATDRIDGEIARSRGLVTDFGTVSDPIADKALMGTALIGLSIIDLLPWWVTVVVLVRELGITVLRFLVIRHGVMPASRGGKLKTVLQATAIIFYVLPLDAFPLSGFLHGIAVVIMALAVIVTVATGVDYVLRAHTLRNTSPRAHLKRKRRAAALLEGAAHEVQAAEAAARDTGARDTGTRDSRAPDAGAPDAGARDAATRDTGVSGAAARHAGARDAAGGSAARHRAGPEV